MSNTFNLDFYLQIIAENSDDSVSNEPLTSALTYSQYALDIYKKVQQHKRVLICGHVITKRYDLTLQCLKIDRSQETVYDKEKSLQDLKAYWENIKGRSMVLDQN